MADVSSYTRFRNEKQVLMKQGKRDIRNAGHPSKRYAAPGRLNQRRRGRQKRIGTKRLRGADAGNNAHCPPFSRATGSGRLRLRRHSSGDMPVPRRISREKEGSSPYPQRAATSLTESSEFRSNSSARL